MSKMRLDLRVVQDGLVSSRSLAQKMIMAGQVKVNDSTANKPSDMVDVSDRIVLTQEPRFVSRGGEKLERALSSFSLEKLSGYVCADIGSSTGGFTDCLLQHGASRVYAIDVGYGILDWKIRNDQRVIVMEKTNARYVAELPEKIDLVTIDASFISLKVLLPVAKNWIKPGGSIIALIKPQFEAGRKDAAKGGGVIRDRTIHRKVLEQTLRFAEGEGFNVEGLIQSPITGPKGNVEFLFHLKLPFKSPFALPKLIEKWLSED
jgi:23S rRNA (cytidine1920-2'-O)/16S rRNA (cytidine1409-2'-O)-methyltransferase